MKLKKTKNQMKREFRQEIEKLKLAIWLKCGECSGYFLDPYEPCSSLACPLRKLFPMAGRIRRRLFKQKLAEVAKAYDNQSFIISQITKDEAK